MSHNASTLAKYHIHIVCHSFRIHDAGKLLTAARGTALLLLETLRGGQTAEEKTRPLHELRVLGLDSRQCIEVLERRTDIKMF